MTVIWGLVFAHAESFRITKSDVTIILCYVVEGSEALIFIITYLILLFHYKLTHYKIYAGKDFTEETDRYDQGV